MPTHCNRKKMDSRGTKCHGRKGRRGGQMGGGTKRHGRKGHSHKGHGHKGRRGGQMGGGFMGSAAYGSAAYGSASQQTDHIARQGTGPANPMSAYLPVNPPACILGGKKHRKKTHKKRSSNKKSAKKHRKGKKRGGINYYMDSNDGEALDGVQ